MRYFSFIPVIDKTDVTDWVKRTYKQMKSLDNKGLPVLYKELYMLLSHFSDVEAELFVDRLTGFRNYGMSLEQLSMSYKMDKADIQLLLTSLTRSEERRVGKEYKYKDR